MTPPDNAARPDTDPEATLAPADRTDFPSVTPNGEAALPPAGPPVAGVGAAPAEPLSLPPGASSWTTLPAPDTAGGAPAADLVHGYEILGELGRGGMGVVYKARQRAAKRLVALKMILSGDHAGLAERERFRTEAEAIARLQHPNIVQVHEVGEAAGKPFFSLEFCGGGSLDRRLAGTPLPPRDAARLVQTLARAMHAAHQHNVIHRDLKPANVLLAGEPDTPLANCEPKITDFGLARKTDEAGQTASGALLGTPSYMAPEQAGGRSKEIGPACDVYALGAILYECLAGRPPFKAATVMDTVRQVLDQEPVPPSRLQDKVPRDLETVCLKCLEKDPRKRYATAADLAEDLRRFQAGEPTQARPIGRLARAWRWARRRPAVAGLLAAVILVAAAGAAGMLHLYQAALRERDRAVSQEQQATVERDRAFDQEKRAARERDRALQAETRAAAAAREARAQAVRAEKVSEFLSGLFQSSDPTGITGYGFRSSDRGRDVTAREVLDRGARQVVRELADQPRVRARLMNLMGRVYRSLGQHDRAAELLEQALAIRRRLPGENRLDVAESLHDLGWLAYDRGDFLRSEQMYREALALRRADATAPLQTADTLLMLGWLLGDIGDPEALEVLQECLRLRTKHLPEGHRDLGAVHVALAAVLIDQGHTTEAMGSVAAARAVFARQENGAQLERAISQLQQGAIYAGLHLYGPAEKAIRESLAIAQGFLGPDSMYVCAVHGLLAQTLHAAGKPKEAEAEFQACLAVARRSVSMAHPRMMIPVDGLAQVLREQGRLREAEPVYQEVVDVARQRLGPNHPGRIVGLLASAALLAELGNRERADQLAGEALDVLGSLASGPAPARRAHVRNLSVRLNLLGLKMASLGKTDRALVLYRAAGDQARAEKNGREELINRANEAHLRLQLKQFDKAAAPMEQALGIARAQTGLPEGDLCFVWETAARLALAGQRPTEAEEDFRQWLEVFRKAPRVDAGNADAVIDSYVALLLESNKPRDATDLLKTYVQALEARKAPAVAVRLRRVEQALVALVGGDRPTFQQLATAALDLAAAGSSHDQSSALGLAILDDDGKLAAKTLSAARELASRDQVPVGLAVAVTPWGRAIGPRLWGAAVLPSQDLLAAALYRAGAYPAAEAAIDRATVWRGRRIDYHELLFRAMARQRQGKISLARQDRALAEQLRQRLVPISTSQRLTWKLLAEEARQLIDGPAKELLPRQGPASDDKEPR